MRERRVQTQRVRAVAQPDVEGGELVGEEVGARGGRRGARRRHAHLPAGQRGQRDRRGSRLLREDERRDEREERLDRVLPREPQRVRPRGRQRRRRARRAAHAPHEPLGEQEVAEQTRHWQVLPEQALEELCARHESYEYIMRDGGNVYSVTIVRVSHRHRQVSLRVTVSPSRIQTLNAYREAACSKQCCL